MGGPSRPPALSDGRLWRLITISSYAEQTATSGLSTYHATKRGVEGSTESLARKVRSFGVHSRIIEPGATGTDFFGSSARYGDDPEEYRGLTGAGKAAHHKGEASQVSSVDAVVRAIIEVGTESDPAGAPRAGERRLRSHRESARTAIE
ncbi:MAG: SDR family NAD(P)-dependent oxidoreductase [Hyphomicrobiales bacterium]|nr:MAG: SDR family NAD(P)-dependent oxidoreductase [Hyphomicrobiales bacterium]